MIPNQRKIIVRLLPLLLSFGIVCTSWAEYPEKSIKLIIAFAPGGITDSVGRAMAVYVNPYLGGKIYVENVSGAGGGIGFRVGAKAAPDGYTLTAMVNSIAVGPHIIKGYPPYELFDFICIVAQNPMLILVKKDSPFNSAKDLVAFAKEKPGKLSGCTSGVGSLSHISIAAFAHAAEFQINLVPYKGAGPCLTALAGGHIDVAPGGVNEIIPLLEAGKLRPVVVLGEKRYWMLPEIPTAKELGYDVVINQWIGIGVPKGTSAEIRAELLQAFRKGTEGEKFRDFLKKMGMEYYFLGPSESHKLVSESDEYFKTIITQMGIQPK
jgi:tripartite-type tricarboxylate transporter receptor subunit TctC